MRLKLKRPMKTINKALINSGWAIVLLALQGCTTTCQVSLPDGNAGGTIHSEGTIYGSKYLSVKPDPGQFASRGIHTVIIKDNLFYDCIGVLTFGFYKPCNISYQSITPGADDGGAMTPPKPSGTH